MARGATKEQRDRTEKLVKIEALAGNTAGVAELFAGFYSSDGSVYRQGSLCANCRNAWITRPGQTFCSIIDGFLQQNCDLCGALNGAQ